ANVKTEAFDRANPLHFYVGRWTKHYKPGQPFLGNPHRVRQHGSRSKAIAQYRAWLWQQLQESRTLRAWLRQLPAGATLFCHCSPLPCHAEVIARAADWIKREWPEDAPLGDDQVGGRGSDPADWVLPFGKHKGLTLGEVFDVNPGYIDWLLGQDWTYL